MMSDPAKSDEFRPVYKTVLTAPDRPDRTLLAIGLLAVAALALTIAMLPGSGEKAEGLLAEGRYGDAIGILVAVEEDRPLDSYESYMLFKLYMLTRQPDSAALLIEQEPALQVDNVWALRQLSDLYRQVRDLAGEANFLRRLYDVSPSDADFMRLRILYRLTGDRDQEASLLAQAIAAGRPDPSLIERLAFLQSAPGQSAQAAVWIAPTGSYRDLGQPAAPQILALSDHTDPSNLKTE